MMKELLFILLSIWQQKQFNRLFMSFSTQDPNLIRAFKLNHLIKFTKEIIDFNSDNTRIDTFSKEILSFLEEEHDNLERYNIPLVKFLNANGYEFQREKANIILNTDQFYEVEDIDMNSSSSYLSLKGFSGTFNSVMFEGNKAYDKMFEDSILNWRRSYYNDL